MKREKRRRSRSDEADEVDVDGGWITVKGERRFKPLRLKRVAHCKSCLFFNKKYESCSRGYCCYPDSPACNDYVNRTYARR